MSGAEAKTVAAEEAARRGPSAWKRLWGDWGTRLCIVAIALYTLTALYGEAVYRYYKGSLWEDAPACLTWSPERVAPYNELHMEARYLPPLSKVVWPAHTLADGTPVPAREHRYWLGSDNLGRDVLQRLVQGARIAFHVGVMTSLIAIPLGVLTSPLGVFVVFTIGMLLWTVGIHGQMVVLMAFQVPYYAQLTINAQLVAAGQPAEFTPVFLLIDAMAVCGGCGNILPLTIQFMRSKSQQLRTIGKAGFFPCLFGVNEPVVYGTPIIFNPVMAIPFVLNTLILYWALYFGYSIGFFAAPYITGTQLPIFVYSFLTSMSVTNLLIPVIAFVIAWIVYYPFVKIYDRDLCEREAKIAEEEAAEAAALQEA